MRNPAYDPKTDSKKARENLPDAFTFTVNTNVEDIYAKIARGDIEDEVATETPTVLRQYQGSPQLKTNDGDRTWYLTMNTDAAAVRRPARSPRGQLRDGSHRPPQGLGRRRRRPDRDAHRA